MNLNKKLVLLLSISGLFIFFFFYIIFNISLTPSLNEQKISFTEKLKKKIQVALSIEEKKIDLICDNWSCCRVISNCIECKTKKTKDKFSSDNLFSRNIFNLMLILKFKKDIIFYKSRKENEFINYKYLNINKGVNKIIKIIRKNPQKIKSIINSNFGPLMIVASPAKSKIKSSHPSGVLIFGRFIDKKMVKRISIFAMENIKIMSLNKEQLSSFYLNQMQGKDISYSEDNDKIIIFYLLKDINNQPSMILQMRANNKLSKIMNRHTIRFIIIIFFSFIFLGVLLYFTIGRYIIGRILKISNTMNKIEGLKDLSIKIKNDKKKDEISSLILNINKMLNKLENERIIRERVEKKLITNEKFVSIGRLSSSIAHEINNPILAISNTIQFIKKVNKKKSKSYKEAIDIAETEIAQIRDIISNLLDSQLMEKIKFHPVNLYKVIMKSLEVLKWSQKSGSLKIVTKTNQDYFVYGSSGKLKQVFINFFLNTSEAIENGVGTLKTETLLSEDKNFYEVHILDNGPGISEEIKDKLFEPFVSTKSDKGVGLGLYVSYRIIKNHGGEIIYNEDYDDGAHFIIKLPVYKRSGNE